MLPYPSNAFHDYVTGYQHIHDLNFLFEESSIALSATMLIAKTPLAVVALETEQVITGVSQETRVGSSSVQVQVRWDAIHNQVLHLTFG